MWETQTIQVGGAAGPLRLLVVRQGVATTMPLTGDGAVVLGRGVEASVVIDDASVSRRHAELKLAPLSVRDLGSANGTTLNGARLEPDTWAPLRPGDAIGLGSVVVLVQARGALQRRAAQRLWSHGYFLARVEEECERLAVIGAGRCAVLRVRVHHAAQLSAAQELLAGALAGDGVLAAGAPDEVDALVLGTSEDDARAWRDELAAALDAARIEATVGLAVSGPALRTPELLWDAAQPAGARREEAGLLVTPGLAGVRALVEKVAPSTLPVLILGPTGAGKELVAEALHRESPRAGRPLVKLNCAGLTESLVESELFGYVRGAFTGALKDREGLFQAADGGTLFLDEVAELPLSTQARLLRALEQREVTPVGAVEPRKVDVRFIAATHRDLAACVREGSFREDLYFRLDGVTIAVPALKDRPADLELLTAAFLSRAAAAQRLAAAPVLSPEARALLRRYHWPGNVRELKHVLERAVLLSSGGVITPEQLPLERLGAGLVSSRAVPLDEGPLDARERIVRALDAAGGNQTIAAGALGVSRQTLMKWMDQHGIARPRKR
ncbi:MAG: sigma 54-interacting transcriptional regulator [Myxococcota bacterium]